MLNKGQVLDGLTQIGEASWYGDKEHKKQTASGEKFNKNAYTAAHKTLPFDTVVRVTNLQNGRDVVVKINDRGPFIGDRIIDLSYQSAKSIDMIRTGTAKVKVEVLSTPSKRTTTLFEALYTVQVGSFSSRINAESMKKDINMVSSEYARIEPIEFRGNTYYRVRVGMFSKRAQAEDLSRQLRSYGFNGKIFAE
ncbi:MAG: septal ring lytic transglycosylase RlpA family protein [Thermodesulfobacteriota bacterium]